MYCLHLPISMVPTECLQTVLSWVWCVGRWVEVWRVCAGSAWQSLACQWSCCSDFSTAEVLWLWRGAFQSQLAPAPDTCYPSNPSHALWKGAVVSIVMASCWISSWILHQSVTLSLFVEVYLSQRVGVLGRREGPAMPLSKRLHLVQESHTSYRAGQ